jgi:beta-mannanase
VHDIFEREGASNVTWVWCPTTKNANSIPFEQLYPGDAYVDWTCLHGYNTGGDTWRSFHQLFSGHPRNPYDSYGDMLKLAPSKPIMLGEWASAEGDDGGARKAAWIQDALQVQIPQNYPNIRAVVWFNWNTDRWKSYDIESSRASIEAFSTAIAPSFYATNDFATLSVSPIPALRHRND